MVVVTVGFRGPAGIGLPEGQEGQIVGYGPGGAPAAVTLPEGTLPPGQPGQLVGYDEDGQPVAVDAPDAGGPAYDDAPLVARIEAVEADVAAIPAPYDDTALSERVDTAQSRADAAYSLAEQGGGTGAYDDTELRGRVTALEDAPAPTWADIAGKPAAFAPSAHGHEIEDIAGLRAELDAVPPPYDDTALAGRVGEVEADVVTAQSRADAAYSLAQQGGGSGAYDDTEVRGLIGAVDDKADANAAAIAAFGPTDWADVTNKPDSFTPSEHTHRYSDITGKPAAFPPSAHAHVIADITGLQTALDGKVGGLALQLALNEKAPTVHSHALADVAGLQEALDGKQDATSFKTVNGEAITGTGDIAVTAAPPTVEIVTELPASPDANTFYVVTG